MGYARLNKNQILKEISGAVTKKVRQKVEKPAKEAVEMANRELLAKFLEHEITQEIANGPYGPTSVLDRGNLFSFLGFYEDEKPIKELAEFLADSIKISSIVTDRARRGVRITLSFPSVDDLDFAELPWMTRNWVEAIEHGISGLGRYIYSEEGLEASNSGSGLEINGNVSSKKYVAKSYLSSIIKDVSKALIKQIKLQSV